ncbi:FtsB family cell division protein [Mycobacterium sp.]|uniref:FtsB family cell division protein n=1 Tax=Mycobacterium sp. TaxID=1785 RepID=UPI003F977DA6
MKAKRETPPPRGGDRRRKQGSASRSTGRRLADPALVRRTRPRGGKASAPAREPRMPRSGPQTTPISRPVERPARPKNASQAKARAKARKAKAPKVVRPPLRERLLNRLASIDLRPRTLAAKVPFVVLVIGSLGAGLGLTLWLSTDSAERSYQLSTARQQNRLLQEQKEALERDVLEAQSAPALAEAARGLGMIPTRDTAHLIQDPTGNWMVVGTPKPAQGVPPPPLNTKLPDEKPAPPANSVEVPMRVLPGNGGLAVPLAPGPQVMVRTPDGATTLGPEHFPTPPGTPQLPAAGPGPEPQGVPAAPPAPGSPPALPPAAGVPTPADPAPAVAPAAPAAPVMPPPVTGPAPMAGPVIPPAAAPPPVDAPPAGVPHLTAPPAAPLIGEQFGPLTVTTPGAPR